MGFMTLLEIQGYDKTFRWSICTGIMWVRKCQFASVDAPEHVYHQASKALESLYYW